MAHVQNHVDASGVRVAHVFDRVATQGDAGRFSVAERGYRFIVHKDNTDQLEDGTPVVTVESGAHLIQLPFDYIVGAKQLIVQVPDPSYYGAANSLLFLTVPSIDERDVATAGWTGPADTVFATYYEEVGSRTVRVYGLPNPTGIVMFVVPHTSLPAASRERIVVNDQSDNAAIELRGPGDGILLRSTSGALFLFRVDESGTPVMEPR